MSAPTRKNGTRAMPRPYQICRRCVMDTSDPLIRFDEAGHCNHCTDFLENRIAVLHEARSSGRSVAELFERVRAGGRGAKYDCVVGVSGGVDSSYVAVLAARHGLRVLAVHLDNGWNSKIAVENIRNLSVSLNMAYASYVLPWTEFRQVQLAFLRASVPEAETPTDVAIQRALHHHALRNGVKFILGGGNIASEGILPATWHYNARDTKYSYAILDHAGCPRKYFRSQKFGLLDEAYAKVVRGICTLYPLNRVDYDKTASRAELEKEYGWKYYGSKHGESRYTKFIQTYYLYVKHGIDYRRATLSSEILVGAVGRAEALAILETLPYSNADVAADIEYVSKKLGIAPRELEEIVAAPPRWFFDYPNNAGTLGMFYDAYRKLTGRRKTSNF